MADSDPFELERFVAAQTAIFSIALGELKAGRKRGHWMWFVFPQLRGLGRSAVADRYGIRSLDEARAYLSHPLLGPRLDQCTRAVLAVSATSLSAIFETPDDLKFVSSMTLFALAVDEDENIFRDVLDRLCGGCMDNRTLALLRPRVR